MGFISKNANTMLLLLIIVSAFSLVGATVFFQFNFERINDAYASKVKQLQDISKEYEQQKAALDSLSGELNLKSAREEEFSEQFTQVRSEKSDLELQRTKLEEQKSAIEADLKETATELLDLREELDEKKALVASLTADVASLDKDYDACIDDLDDEKEDLQACQATLATCTCP